MCTYEIEYRPAHFNENAYSDIPEQWGFQNHRGIWQLFDTEEEAEEGREVSLEYQSIFGGLAQA